ncbi:NADP-dependent oxidoreductase [Azospirillum sp.]|uniref:NADP-dependent oxidoreductase n=1 Tax=Azospirillum sp. TaxID=34012 RepID=UPI002D50DE59|nr:NADP-dependent oxidoreductase [Azospirillum sp.]HYD70041.1 NADP-dependent oxidoreductase [Azospirillum sp.]
MPTLNRQIRLRARPDGIPQAEHFEMAEAPLEPLTAGQFRVRNDYLSVDPAMRGWVSAVGNYSTPVGLGEVMRSFAAGEVVESRHPDYPVGERVMGLFGWQRYAVSDGRSVIRKVREHDLPLSASLGILGLNGITAYLGLTEIGQPKAGETVVVSTAAGSVGAAVGQIAKLLGCRTVGITGGPEKVDLCRAEFGYDAALDYKAESDLSAAVAAACPDGVHVYFDNTAGAVSDAVHPHLAIGARVVVCGTASIASWDPPPVGPRVERHILVKRARMQGFLFFDHAAKFDAAVARLADWLRAGKLRHREDILDGIEQAPGAIAGLYRGENLGKRLIRLTDA